MKKALIRNTQLKSVERGFIFLVFMANSSCPLTSSFHHIVDASVPVSFFPEKETTNGKALLKFW